MAEPGSAAQLAADAPSPSSSAITDPLSYCRELIDHNQTALAAMQTFIDDPSGQSTDVIGVKAARATLTRDAETAPAQLRPDLEKEAAVLGDIIEALDTGVNRTIETGTFSSASIRVLTGCEGAAR
ncbi:hypothetical protein GCM10022223_37980 [Kineosporia mesophila]|uniref:Uncharacterized protein n=1 Tax=Kineosporia mesophila TaxID=566012 RepID=A0ABP6ZUG6_9ACTN|nr:hypothetical protein [Kineosporia mesophila]MCD5349779.1 hypothetical protein [Kineosporia mesophila]